LRNFEDFKEDDSGNGDFMNGYWGYLNNFF
jgi:hypothetical protein